MMKMLGAALLLGAALAVEQVQTEHFDSDPHWDAHNNRLADQPGRETIQRFGFSQSNHAGGATGEIGGTIQTAAERAFYALPLAAPLSLDAPIHASGRLAFAEGRATGPVFVGFFNRHTSFGWRAPDAMGIRIDGRGEVLHAHIEYATSKWRAGAGMIAARNTETERMDAIEFPAAGAHVWSFDYDPATSAATFVFDGKSAVMTISPEHRGDGASFDAFGMMNIMKSSDNRSEVYLDDLDISGVEEHFDSDPQWIGEGNQTKYLARIVRPWFDFGYSATSYAGGAPGEMGGVVFRGDYRFETTKAYYGARTSALSLEKPLRASGKISLLRGVSDSGALIGWFHATRSLDGGTDKSTIPQDFVGAFIEGPSSEGFFFRPAYRMHGEDGGTRDGPYIYPDAKPREWTIEFVPGPDAHLAVTLDGARAELPVPAEHLAQGAAFDHFGIITTQIDGNLEIIYFDDLTFTVEQ